MNRLKDIKNCLWMVALLSALILCVPCKAQSGKYKADTLVYSGKSSTVTDIVFLGEGYTQNEMNKFVRDVKELSTYFFNKEPWKHYSDMFNVFYVKTPSNESGAGMTPDKPIDTFYKVTFGYAGVDRMPWPSDGMAKVYEVLKSAKPDYDMVVIVVNSTKYGGAGGGKFMCVSMDYWSKEVICHESGHAYADLADEYWYERYSESVNDTRQKDPVKWARWVNPNGKGPERIGVYEFEDTVKNWFRPHENCLMRYLQEDYCAVCREAIVEKIHSTGRLLKSYSPKNTVKNNIAEGPATYTIETVKVTPNTLRREWTLNGQTIAMNTDELVLTPEMMTEAYSTLKVTIEDTTTMVRVENHSKIHMTSVQWTVKYDEAAGISTVESDADEFIVGPIPLADELTFSSHRKLSDKVSIALYDINGSLVVEGSFNPDEYCSVPVAGLSPGVYMVTVYIGDRLVYSAKVIK